MSWALSISLAFVLCHGVAAAGCYKHASCQSCIGEQFGDGSCMWYTPPIGELFGSCIAAKVGFTPLSALDSLDPTKSYASWSVDLPGGSGTSTAYTAWDVDVHSSGACYNLECSYQPSCDLGFYAVSNQPCYRGNVHPDWRVLTCCRQQRNIDGYLRGFEAWNGVVQGTLHFATCCMPCSPGTVLQNCTAFSSGVCVTCPVGTYNAQGTPGSTCLPCQPCPPGTQRVGCGPSSAGVCVACDFGKYKLPGLEGAASDQCQACAGCPDDSWRIDCGGNSSGYCEKCPAGRFWASPFCKYCDACLGDAIRAGCGGLQSGVCVSCSASSYTVTTSLGTRTCRNCDACPAVPAMPNISLVNLSGPQARIGCGGSSTGACVGLGVALQIPAGTALCPTPTAPNALCAGSTLKLTWALSGLSAFDLSDANCTAASAACMAPMWQASLMMRTAESPQGVAVQDLGQWWPLDLNPLPSPVGTFLADAQVGPLDPQLQQGFGYFIQMALMDKSSSCCSASPASPLTANTVDFALPDPNARLQSLVAQAYDAMADGNQSVMVDLLTSACGGASTAAASALPDLWNACELLKAAKYGLPLGQRTLMPQPLMQQAGSSLLAAAGAVWPILTAQQALAQLEQLQQAAALLLPQNATAWRQLVAPMARLNSSNLNVSNSPLAALYGLTMQLVAAADVLQQQWTTEVNTSAQRLPELLAGLNTLDAQLSAACIRSGFDLVRLEQAVTWQLWANSAGPTPGQSRSDWYTANFQTIISTAALLVGIWGNSWVSDIRWSLAATLGDPTQWPPEGAMEGLAFGGVPSAPDAVPLAQSRTRVWTPFKNVALAWIDMWQKEARKLQGTNSTVQTTTPMPASTQELADAVVQVLDLVEQYTENLIEPLTRADSTLLGGPLPNISSCANTGYCLSALAQLIPEDQAAATAWLGLGNRAIRVWLDPVAEELRLKRAAAEVVSITRGRLRLLEELMQKSIDVRSIQPEPANAGSIEALAQRAGQRLTAIASPASSGYGTASGPDAPWEWDDLFGGLSQAIEQGRRATGRLARRRLSSLERLIAWIKGIQDDGTAAGPSGWKWRMPWNPRTDTAQELLASAQQAQQALQTAIDDANTYTTKRLQANLRITIDDSSRPLTFTGFRTSVTSVAGNTAVLRIEGPKGAPGMKMHGQANAFLVSPNQEGDVLLISNSITTSARTTASPTARKYVEVRLQRLSGASGPLSGIFEPPQTAGSLYVTRHVRRSCAVLPMPATGVDTSSLGVGAFMPLDGFWVVRAFDGLTGMPMQIDPGTSILIMIKMDVPDTAPPWELINGFPDMLYRMPADGQCNNVAPIFGTLPTTSGAPTTAAAGAGGAGGGLAGGGAIPTTSESSGTVAAFLAKSDSAKSGPSSGQMAGILGAGIGCGIGLVLASFGGWYWRRRRLARKEAEAAKAAAMYSAAMPQDSPQSEVRGPMKLDIDTGLDPSSEGLRQRTPSPKPEGHGLRGVASASYAPPTVSALQLRDHEDWGVTNTPEGSPVQSHSGDGEGSHWNEAATPLGSSDATPLGSSSGSGRSESGSSSRSSSADSRPGAADHQASFAEYREERHSHHSRRSLGSSAAAAAASGSSGPSAPSVPPVPTSSAVPESCNATSHVETTPRLGVGDGASTHSGSGASSGSGSFREPGADGHRDSRATIEAQLPQVPLIQEAEGLVPGTFEEAPLPPAPATEPTGADGHRDSRATIEAELPQVPLIQEAEGLVPGTFEEAPLPPAPAPEPTGTMPVPFGPAASFGPLSPAGEGPAPEAPTDVPELPGALTEELEGDGPRLQ